MKVDEELRAAANVWAAMMKARYEFLPESKMFYGEIPRLRGVYAYADTLEECEKELEEVLEEWVLIRVPKVLQNSGSWWCEDRSQW
jgi:predicted RNase H-like HicB family nuclease